MEVGKNSRPTPNLFFAFFPESNFDCVWIDRQKQNVVNGVTRRSKDVRKCPGRKRFFIGHSCLVYQAFKCCFRVTVNRFV